MLDLKLELRDAAGNLLTSADTSSLGETLSTNLTAGTYYLLVASHGGYGDVGQYTLTATLPSATPAPIANAGGPYSVNEGGSVQLSAAASTGSSLTYLWDLDGDGVYGETGASATPSDRIACCISDCVMTLGIRTLDHQEVIRMHCGSI